MRKIKSFAASALIAAIVLAGIGFGVMFVGFAIVLGGAAALAVRLGGVAPFNRAEEPEMAEPAKPEPEDAVPA